MSDTNERTQIRIYIIMPFSQTSEARTKDFWDEHFADFLCARIKEATNTDPVLAGFDWNIDRSSTVRGGPLNYEIVWDLLWSQIVIADLTDLNYNVLYELGVRHAFSAAFGAQRTIMIQDETAFRLPFDFANYAVIKYRKDKVDTWKRDICDRLRSCLESYRYRDNPVSMTFAQHSFSFQQQNPQEQATANFKASLDIIERMINLGFDVRWIQDVLSQSILKAPQSPGPAPEIKTS